MKVFRSCIYKVVWAEQTAHLRVINTQSRVQFINIAAVVLLGSTDIDMYNNTVIRARSQMTSAQNLQIYIPHPVSVLGGSFTIF